MQKAFITKRLFTICFAIMSGLIAHAQYYIAGQDPASVKFREIESEHFHLVYAEEFELYANSAIQVFESVYEQTSASLKHQPKKISVLMHNFTTQSNAFLAWTPRRMELYMTPYQDLDAMGWLEHLAIHEFRHAVQFDKIEEEMPGFLKLLFGQQVGPIIAGAYLPMWFVEGDAVSVETSLSKSGRGRSADFFREIRTQLIDGEKYSYDKAYLGSYTDNVANHYHMGYLLVAGARAMDSTVWEDVVHSVARKPFSITPFNRALKQEIGLGRVQLYDSIFSNLQHKWRTEDAELAITSAQQRTPKHKHYTEYLYPYKVAGDEYIALRSSFNDVDRFVRIDTSGNESVIYTPGYIQNQSVHITDEKIVWIEYQRDIRWSYGDESALCIYDLASEKVQRFAYENSILAPKLSPDQSQVLVVETTTDYNFNLTMIDSETGEILQQIVQADHEYIASPVWGKDKNEIYCVLVSTEHGKYLSRYNRENNTWNRLSDDARANIKDLCFNEGNLYCVADFTGIDQLYRYDVNQRSFQLKVQRRFGIRNPSVQEEDYIFSDYHLKGYQIAECIDPSTHEINIEKAWTDSYPMANLLAEQEGKVIDFSIDSTVVYESKPYRKWAHLVNIHSWAPLAIDPYEYDGGIGASIVSQNLLSTSHFAGGYQYNVDNDNGMWYFRYRYDGFLPRLSFDMTSEKQKYTYGIINTRERPNGTYEVIDTVFETGEWRTTNFTYGVDLPLNFSRGRWYTSLTPLAEYHLMKVSNEENLPESLSISDYGYLHSSLKFTHQLNSSIRDVLPNFGFSTTFTYLNGLHGLDLEQEFAGELNLYLPGISRNHGLYLYGGYQKKDEGDVQFNDVISIARGFSSPMNDEMFSLKAMYMLPIYTPEFSIPGIAYVKRFQINAFADYTEFKGVVVGEDDVFMSYNGNISSVGIDIKAEVYPFRLMAPLTIGMRNGYRISDKSYFADLLFNASLSF